MFFNSPPPPTPPTPRPLCCGGLSQRPGQPVHPLSPAVLQPTLRNPYNPTKLDLQAGTVDKWFRTQPGVIRDAHLVPHSHGTKVPWFSIPLRVQLLLGCMVWNWSKVKQIFLTHNMRRICLYDVETCSLVCSVQQYGATQDWHYPQSVTSG